MSDSDNNTLVGERSEGGRPLPYLGKGRHYLVVLCCTSILAVSGRFCEISLEKYLALLVDGRTGCSLQSILPLLNTTPLSNTSVKFRMKIFADLSLSTVGKRFVFLSIHFMVFSFWGL